MKRCQTCGRELQDPATTCDACDAWAAAVVDSPNRPDPVSADTKPVAAPAAGARREILFVAAALAGVALLTIAFMLVRRVPTATVSAAPVSLSPAPPLRSSTASTSTSTSAPATTPSWSIEHKARWLGDERGAAWEVAADNVVQTWFGPSHPLLVVRCAARTTDVIVYTGSPMMIEPRVDGKTVTVTVDNEETNTERWMDADHRDALFAPDGAAFARRLLHATTLQVGYTPHNFSPVVARFHVTGLAPLIERSAKDCGWKEKP